MTSPNDLIKERVDDGSLNIHKLYVENTPGVEGGTSWTAGDVAVGVRKGVSVGEEGRILISATRRTGSTVHVDIAFTPDSAVAIAVAIMRKVQELKEGDKS